MRSAVTAYRFRNSCLVGPWQGHQLAFVWQRHDLFQRAGLIAARHFKCPLVLFVDAPVVWEARRWGVGRPGWGRLLERVAEESILRQADLVACVSPEVASAVSRLGVVDQRIIITPCGVDPHFAVPVQGSTSIRDTYGLQDRFVVGWLGSFRRFHGLEVLVEAAAMLQQRVPDLALLLVGEGQQRATIENACRTRGLGNIHFTGLIPHGDVPRYLSAMDVAVATAPSGSDFHYSPLKVREYMACGLPVIAPQVGELARTLAHRNDAFLVEPGDAIGMANAIETLYADSQLRISIGRAAYERVQSGADSWDHQVTKVMDRLRVLA